MSDFRTYHVAKREPAIAMQAVIDPAAWLPEFLGPVEDWAYRISDSDQEELFAAVEAFRRRHIPLPDVNKENFPLARLAEVLMEVRSELAGGRGMVMI